MDPTLINIHAIGRIDVVLHKMYQSHGWLAGIVWYFSWYFDSWVFPNMVVPQNGWFITENLIKMDDLGVPLFSETPSLFLFVVKGQAGAIQIFKYLDLLDL